MPNIENIKKYKNIHMIGIGGISMSGIAIILRNWGFNITGSDTSDSEVVESLKQNNIKVTIGHNVEDIKKCDCVIYSAAVKQDDIEIIEAKKLNKEIIERADFLGEITKCYKDNICVSGTHGKTTTTSMLSLCFIESLKDPSIQVGAYLKQLDGNYRVGNSEIFIIEACEYVESFLKFHPKSEIILNIDNDHLDYFKNFENIKKAFRKYVKILPNDGLLVVNADDKNCIELKKYTNAKFITYGIENEKANYVGKNIKFNDEGFAKFDVYKNEKYFETIKLSVPGKHNVLNALACIALSTEYNIDIESIKNGLKKFTGAHRRFEFVGKIDENVSVYDDYAHHPTEIEATYNSLKNKKYNKSFAVFQPHTYSRTKNLLEATAKSLLGFDNILILDIYSAREKDIYNISSIDLVNKIKELNDSNKLNKNVKYVENFDKCVDIIKSTAKKGDIVMTIGAGTVTKIGPMLVDNI